MTSWLYAILFLALVLFWPLGLLEARPPLPAAWPWVALAVNTVLLIAVWYYHSSSDLSFFRGLDIICGSMMTGCANITILFLPIVLTVVYIYLVGDTLVGMVRGRAYTQERWKSLVLGFYQRRIHR
jgi:hypothetical protein